MSLKIKKKPYSTACSSDFNLDEPITWNERCARHHGNNMICRWRFDHPTILHALGTPKSILHLLIARHWKTMIHQIIGVKIDVMIRQSSYVVRYIVQRERAQKENNSWGPPKVKTVNMRWAFPCLQVTPLNKWAVN